MNHNKVVGEWVGCIVNLSSMTFGHLHLKGNKMKKIENLVTSKGICLLDNDYVLVTYMNQEGPFLSVTFSPMFEGSTLTYEFDSIETMSEKFMKKYSSVKIFKFLEKDIEENQSLLGEVVKTIYSIQEETEKPVFCFDSLMGVQNFYDLEGNYLLSSSDIFDESDIELLKEILESFE